jgi:dipeptidyl aminopeptidase/acylaminoacyl peptidase
VLLLTAGAVACSDGDDGDGADEGGSAGTGDGCGDDSLVVAFDHETIDPDRGIGGGVPEISVAAQGGDPEMITGDWVVSQPDFSPDGDRLVVVKADGDYESAGPEATALWVIGTDGIDATEPRELTGGDVLDEDPDWSPDGETIAFSRTVFDTATETYHSHVMTMPAEGGEPRELVGTTAVGEQLDEPTWSPDGTRLAYIRSVYDQATNDTTNTVWTMAADGSGAEPLDATLDYVDDVAWHPDGTSLLVAAGDGLVVVDLGTGAVEPIEGQIRSAAWAPDGEHLYHARYVTQEESDRGIQRSRVEDGALVDTEDVVVGRHPAFGLAVGPCG